MEEPNNWFLISQIIGGMAIIVDIITFQFKKREHVLWCLLIATTLLAIHFFILNKETAGWMMGIAASRYLIGIYKQNFGILLFYILITILMTVWSFAGLLSILSGSANLLQTLGSFRKNDKELRILMIAGSIIWLVHNSIAATPAGVLAEVIFLGGGLIGYYRFYLKKTPLIK